MLIEALPKRSWLARTYERSDAKHGLCSTRIEERHACIVRREIEGARALGAAVFACETRERERVPACLKRGHDGQWQCGIRRDFHHVANGKCIARRDRVIPTQRMKAMDQVLDVRPSFLIEHGGAHRKRGVIRTISSGVVARRVRNLTALRIDDVK